MRFLFYLFASLYVHVSVGESRAKDAIRSEICATRKRSRVARPNVGGLNVFALPKGQFVIILSPYSWELYFVHQSGKKGPLARARERGGDNKAKARKKIPFLRGVIILLITKGKKELEGWLERTCVRVSTAQ
jgi:hypothetical protein